MPTAAAGVFPASAPSPPPQERPGARCPATSPKLATEGVITRQRKPGGVYAYVIDRRFLPAQRGVSHQRGEQPVPPARTEENQAKKIEGSHRRFAGFAAISNDGLPLQPNWEPRLRGWLKSRFWLDAWGPKPSEPGCFGPPSMMTGLRAG